MPWRNTPEKFFPRYGAAHGRAQEPTPGSAVKFCGESVRKNRTPVPRSNIAASWARGGGGTGLQSSQKNCVIQDFSLHCSSTQTSRLLLNSVSTLLGLEGAPACELERHDRGHPFVARVRVSPHFPTWGAFVQRVRNAIYKDKLRDFRAISNFIAYTDHTTPPQPHVSPHPTPPATQGPKLQP